MNPSPLTAGQVGEIKWHLRELMAGQGLFKTTDLITPLREHGIQLSREQIFRLVTKTPSRLNLDVLVALCGVLKCTPNDLLEVVPGRAAASNGPGVDFADGAKHDTSIGELRPIRAVIRRPDSY